MVDDRGNSCTIDLSWTNDNWIVRDYQHMVKMEGIFLFLFQAAWYEGPFFFYSIFFLFSFFTPFDRDSLLVSKLFFNLFIFSFFLFTNSRVFDDTLNDNFKLILLIFFIAALAIARIAIYNLNSHCIRATLKYVSVCRRLLLCTTSIDRFFSKIRFQIRTNFLCFYCK